METKELRHKRMHATRRSIRTRKRLQGTAERPRLSVYISLLHVSAQIIDDTNHKTLVYVGSKNEKSLAKASLTEKATWVGEQIADAAKAKKISQVIFDRGAKRYHGRVAAMADAARTKGLEF